MSKAILVIDIPNLESHEIDSYDMVADLKVKSLVLGGERYDCEFENVIVRPLPPYKKSVYLTDHKSIMISQPSIYESGWNACLDEILWGTDKYQKQIDEALGKDIVDKFFGGEE